MASPIPPPHEPILDKDTNRVNDVWYRFFEGNFTALNTAESGTPSAIPVPVSDGGTGQATEAEALGELTQALTEDTTPDRVADYVAVYDASADTGKKVLLGRAAGCAVLATGSVSAGSSLDLALDTYTQFKIFKLYVFDATVGTDASWLALRFSDDGGATFEADASDYGWNFQYGVESAGGGFALYSGDDLDDEIVLTSAAGNAAGEGSDLEITIFNPADTGTQTRIVWGGLAVINTGLMYSNFGCGRIHAAGASTDVRVYPSAGTFSCNYTLMGIV